MVINGESLLQLAPIKDMYSSKQTAHGVSHGLSEAGYDIRIKQSIYFRRPINSIEILHSEEQDFDLEQGRFVLASTVEEFQMPSNLVGIVHDKSTWARRGLSVFNTVIESGWNGFLTLELVYHGQENLLIPAGSGIAQVIFHELKNDSTYTGKYQGQEDMPVPARNS